MDTKLVKASFFSILFAISGCGGSGTSADWSSTLFSGSVHQVLSADGFLKEFASTTEGYSLIHASNYSASNQYAITTLDKQGEQTGTQQLAVTAHTPVSKSVNGYWVTEKQINCCNESVELEVEEMDANGNILWKSSIKPDLTTENEGAAANFVSMNLSFSDNASNPQKQDVLLLITGLDSSGAVNWQKKITQDSSLRTRWSAAWHESGKACYIQDKGTTQHLVCLDTEGAEKFNREITTSYYHKLYLLADHIVVTSGAEGQNTVDIFDEQGSSLQTATMDRMDNIAHVIGSSDGKIHVFEGGSAENGNRLILATVDGLGDVTYRDFSLPSASDFGIITVFPEIFGKVSIATDLQGNLFFGTMTSDSKSFLGIEYDTLQGSIRKLDRNGVLSVIAEGRWSGYNYRKADRCLYRCLSTPNLEVLTDLFTLPDGSLVAGWGTGRMDAECGEFGACALLPYLSAFNLKHYSP